MSSFTSDPEEIAKFNRLAAEWWDSNGACAPLHQLNPLRLSFIRQYAGELHGKSIVDIGCGGGILSEALAAEGAQVLGVDQAKAVIDVAQQHAQAQPFAANLTYACTTVESLASQAPASYDMVVCMEMLEHVPEPESILQACSALLKPQGKIFFSTLNRNVKAYLQAIIAAEYLLKLLPRGTHDYARFIKPNELLRWARGSGLQCLALQGISYHPLRKRYHLTDKVDVNYLAAFTKI